MTTLLPIEYRVDGATIALHAEEAGGGPTVVLLPSLSSISTRAEMRPLMDRLASRFRVVTVDWPGFGDLPRARVDWTPDLLSDFLRRFLADHAPGARAIVAAGHAATYALAEAARDPAVCQRLALIAPTWRGPFPTMVGGTRPWFARVRAAVDQPLVGPLLYRLNVSDFVVGRMARAHVYSDPDWLADDARRTEKRAVTSARGARHASVRFVTGALDRVGSRDAFHDLVRRAGKPVLIVYGAETPPKSRAEMTTMADLPDLRVVAIEHGKLAVHEEFPDAVADAVLPFLA